MGQGTPDDGLRKYAILGSLFRCNLRCRICLFSLVIMLHDGIHINRPRSPLAIHEGVALESHGEPEQRDSIWGGKDPISNWQTM